MTAVQGRVLELAEDAQDLLFRRARTANAFAEGAVSEEQVRAIYELVKWGPTAMNGQPLRVVLVRTPEGRERLARHLSEGNRAKTLSAPLTAVLAADTDFHENLPTVFPHLPGAKDYFVDAERRAESARFNALLQAGYFVLGVRAAGLAAGPMSGFDAAGVDGEFFPDGRLRSLVVVNIGNPAEAGTFPRSPRLDYDDVVLTV
ncbi:malonic semialdehyde reductase [Actinokineospora cianjurensis]|uniref:3-hydroxypropanoate dehydrogenase n=1 Tax=Actinokineospora cianjurensis TaxID=585224 RepID=A0A421BCC7_9PSEU|nr:malonic semialdehyde reductase [Actinokineospora cianjurensis]RLK62035.1 3-hydroxypropanoate dehydrogenase [Actinokineospora cianjurensis]